LKALTKEGLILYIEKMNVAKSSALLDLCKNYETIMSMPSFGGSFIRWIHNWMVFKSMLVAQNNLFSMASTAHDIIETELLCFTTQIDFCRAEKKFMALIFPQPDRPITHLDCFRTKAANE
jgi:hypothetical protein